MLTYQPPRSDRAYRVWYQVPGPHGCPVERRESTPVLVKGDWEAACRELPIWRDSEGVDPASLDHQVPVLDLDSIPRPYWAERA